MGKYIFSTLTASQKYPIYEKVPGRDIPRMSSYVLIHGGANLPSKVLVTPRGVMTSISDEQFERLNQCSSFQKHVNGGYLTVEDRSYDPDEAAEDMEPKDSSAPMVPEDFEAAGTDPPTTGAVDQEELDMGHVGTTQRPAQAAARTPEEKRAAEKAKAAEDKAAAKKRAADDKEDAKSPRKRRGRPPMSES